jgi:hypothetical protein
MTRAPIALLAALAVSLASAPAAADIYKWVDDAGMTHYSNTPPPNPEKAEVVIEDKLSTYSSDPAETRAAAQAASRSQAESLARRVDYLERELAAQRQASQYAAATDAQAMPAPYEQAFGYGAPYVVYGAPVIVPRRFAHRHGRVVPSGRVAPISSLTGLPAGNVVNFRTAAPRSGRSFRSK